MTKVTLDDLKAIKAKTMRHMAVRGGFDAVKITVHMGDCGINAGAREVMKALLTEMAAAERDDIRVVAADCLGKCKTEPNVTVEIKDQPAVIYQKMDADKIRQVFKAHILEGEVQSAYMLA